MNHIIRLYQPEDKEKFQYFINHYWRKNHIIATSKTVFDFQHYMENRYTFVIAENVTTHEIDGVYGYILTHKYDTSHQIPNIGWGAIWKIREDVFAPGLGMALLKYMLKNEPVISFAGNGTSSMADKLYDVLRYKKGTLEHYYIANPAIPIYHIAQSPICKKALENEHARISQLTLQEAEGITNTVNPYKNICYFQHRYAEHPIYKYRFYGCFIDEKLQQLYVVRKQKMCNNCCLRIVDMIGTSCTYDSTAAWQKVLREEGAEYVDCMNYGIAPEFFEDLGFSKVEGDTVIPDYFAPFEQRNTKVNLVYSNTNLNLVIFKGDGDQDRPNSEERENW